MVAWNGTKSNFVRNEEPYYIVFQPACSARPKYTWLLLPHLLSLVCKMRQLLGRLMYATGMK